MSNDLRFTKLVCRLAKNVHDFDIQAAECFSLAVLHDFFCDLGVAAILVFGKIASPVKVDTVAAVHTNSFAFLLGT